MKRIVSVLLSICLILTLFPVTTKADEIQTKYLKVSVDEKLKIYECLLDNEEIYCSVENLAEIANFDWEQIEDELNYYFFREYEGLYNNAIQIQIGIEIGRDKDIANVETMGKSYTMNCYVRDGKLYLPLEKLLYLLHSEWAVVDDIVYVTPMPLTILDFIAIYEGVLIEIATQSEDVLINTGWLLSDTEIGQAVYSAISEVFSDFDGKIFMLWWPGEGHVETAESYENAILQLAREDKEFIGEEVQEEALTEAVNSVFYLNNKYLSKIQNIINIPENIDEIVKSVPDAIELLENSKSNSKKINSIAENIDDIEVKNLPVDAIEAVGDGLALLQCVWNTYDTATRVKGWNEEYLAQLQVLADYEEFGCINENVAGYVRSTAQQLVDSYHNPSEAAVNEALQSTLGFLLNKTFDATPFGKGFSIMNAVGACYGVFDVEAADTYDMYAELQVVSFSVKIEQMVKYLLDYSNLLNASELTNEKIEDYRNQLMLYLRLNLRNKAQLYNLNIRGNEDKNWVESQEAKDLYKEIVLVYTMLAELIETKDYDSFIILDEEWDIFNYTDRTNAVFSEILIDENVVVSVDWQSLYTDIDENGATWQYGIITAFNEQKEVVWTYETKKCMATELDAVSTIGMYNDKYYFVENGSIVVLNLSDGSKVWENSDFGGASPSFDFGANGELYICGAYGPDFFAVDINGKTLSKIKEFSETHWWPYKIECLDNTVLVTLAGGENYFEGEVTYIVNLIDFSYTLFEDDKQISNDESLYTYKEVLDRYAIAMEECWDMNALNEVGLNYICAYYTNDQIGYTYIDIDKNGVEELIIHSIDDRGYIFDMYTIVDNEMIQVLSSMERDSYYLGSDGSIINDGAGSAIETGYRRYVIGNDGYTLFLVEGIVYDGYYAKEIGLINDISECSEDNSYFYFGSNEKYVHISAEEAETKRKEFASKENYMDLKGIPFSEYN